MSKTYLVQMLNGSTFELSKEDAAEVVKAEQGRIRGCPLGVTPWDDEELVEEKENGENNEPTSESSTRGERGGVGDCSGLECNDEHIGDTESN